MGGSHSSQQTKERPAEHGHKASHHPPKEKPRDLVQLIRDRTGDGERQFSTLLLCDLDLKDCEMPQVCAFLEEDTFIKEVDLANNLLTDAVLGRLMESLHHNTTISSLRIAGNHFSSSGVRTLRAFLSCKSVLTSARKRRQSQVELRALGINVACGPLLRDFLSSCQFVTSMNLHENPLGPDGVKLLCEGLIRSTSIRSLILYGSDMGPWGAFHLAKAFPLTGIVKLNLYKSHLGNHGATIIADIVQTSTSLRSLLLGYNDIQDDGAKAIATALSTNETLRELDLYSNRVRNDGVIALADALKMNHALRFLLLASTLHISHLTMAENMFNDEGVKALADAVLYNHQLQALDLGIEPKLREQCKSLFGTINAKLDENRSDFEHRKRVCRMSRDLLRRSMSIGSMNSENGSPIQIMSTALNEIPVGSRGSLDLSKRFVAMMESSSAADKMNGSSSSRAPRRVLIRNVPESERSTPVLGRERASSCAISPIRKQRLRVSSALARTTSDPILSNPCSNPRTPPKTPTRLSRRSTATGQLNVPPLSPARKEESK